MARASELDSAHLGFTADVFLKDLNSIEVSRMTCLFYLESFCNIYRCCDLALLR